MFLVCNAEAKYWGDEEKSLCPIIQEIIRKSSIETIPQVEIIESDLKEGRHLYAEACVNTDQDNSPVIRISEKSLQMPQSFIRAIIAHEVGHIENNHHIQSIENPHTRIIDWERVADKRAAELTSKQDTIFMIEQLLGEATDSDSIKEYESRIVSLSK